MNKIEKMMFWKRGKLVRNPEKCIFCGKCGTCPHLALKVDPEKKVWKFKGLCMRCGKCIRECPAQALSLVKPG